ncbi:MAG: hypothetical protein ACRDMZ_21215, partial [Solirubrobacteraceae bacterium]
MLTPLALLVAAAAAVPCKASGPLAVYVAANPVKAADTIYTARLCLTVPTRGARLASMSGRLTIDTAFAKLIDVARAPRTPFLANADSSGNVLVAGAAGSAVRGGTVLTVRVRLARPGVLPRVDFIVSELSGSDGKSLITHTTVSGLAARCVGTHAAVFEVLPPSASADPGEPLDLRISGCGFNAARNTVRFGDVTVNNIRSTNSGT